MNGIDTAIASLLASRVDSLLNIAPGAPSTAQAGASALSGDTPVTPGTPEVPTPPPASAQTVLSAVAQTLNAIALSGGEVTTAILGQLPIWPAAPALDVEMAELPLFDSAGGQSADAGNPNAANTANTANPTSATGTTATAATSVAASPVPVAALAAALEQTVAGSGLFYEAHLAQWLAGQFTLPDLASEPQNRLLDTASQLPLDWAADADAGAQPGSASASAQQARPGTTQTAGGAAEGNSAARAQPSIMSPQAARFAAGEVLANSLSDLSAQPERAALHAAVAQTSDTPTQATQSVASAINAATVPLVRQQLDMLHRAVSLERRSVAGREIRLDHPAGRRRVGARRRGRRRGGGLSVAHPARAVVADAGYRGCRTDPQRQPPVRAGAGQSAWRGSARRAKREFQAAPRRCRH
jgi:hypothetical protein